MGVQIKSLGKLKTDRDWSFSNLSRKETNYASHGYHKYPAKFIPQIVDKLLDKYSRERDIVLDPFGGCGTTLVESKIKGRNSICIDINESAILIANAKKTAISPNTLERKNELLIKRIKSNIDEKNYYGSAHPRLKYWFKEKQYNKLMRIFNEIQKEKEHNIRIFYNCCFSNILKNCSIWYSKSIKPMKDLKKRDVAPMDAFSSHLNFMTHQNEEFYDILKNSDNKVFCKIMKNDARKMRLPNESVDIIITSPPYATSYEYADLHQLSLLWFKFTYDLKKVREEFIGSLIKRQSEQNIDSKIAYEIIKKLQKKDKGLAGQIGSYVTDLKDSFAEMERVLKKGKRLCLIIGNTEYKGVKILNTEISVEILKKLGFKIEDIKKRKLSSKIFTPYRDKSGRFTNKLKGKKKNIYQYEYIVIARK